MARSGYLVKINHFRYTKDGKFIRTYNNSRSKEKYGSKPEYSACGGLTTVQIRLSSKTFSAICSKKDHFCFKDGTYLAVSRAYTYFKEHCEEMEQGVEIQQEVPEIKSCCGGKCCKDIQDTDEGTYGVVIKEATKFRIVCIDPNTQEFIGYVTKDDPLIRCGGRSWQKILSSFESWDYTKEVNDAAEFETKEEAERYLSNTAERVIKVDYKLIGQVTVTDM